jgi:hypothetical protein
VVKRRKPAESHVTRIGPVQNQVVRSRILDSAGQNEDASEGTYDGLKPTGMMARDRAPELRRFDQLLESLQDGGVISQMFCDGLVSAVLTFVGREILVIPVARGH